MVALLDFLTLEGNYSLIILTNYVFYAIALLVFHCMLFFSFRHGQNLFCTQLSYWANAKINKDSALLPKKTLFFPPKREELFAAWKTAIPRSDMDLRLTSLICEEHFLPEYIVSHFQPPSVFDTH